MSIVKIFGGNLSLQSQEATDRFEYLLEEDMLFEYLSALFNNNIGLPISDIMSGNQKNIKQQAAIFDEFKALKDMMIEQQKLVSDIAKNKVVVSQPNEVSITKDVEPTVEKPVVKKAPKKAPGGKKGGFGMGGRGIKKRTD